MKIGIIDHGMGNILSVLNAIEYLGYEGFLIKTQKDFSKVDKFILPGVGAFSDCMKNLVDKNFINILNKEIIENKRPILGICLGMQVMAKYSNEGTGAMGLGWFDAEVIKIETNLKELKVPHIGWNNLEFNTSSILFKNIPQNSSFYFVHSFYMNCFNSNDVVATVHYGTNITAAIQKENIVATQFHPEKSQEIGLRVLENYISWKF